eukprot:TRINITY_DN16182_c4_g1_i1.p1 TRINITY_DN16182_c4_g1~~TRINITY_DN16182_c4_g1_i1.p1  ORF type:complete len:428 (+),score=68.04 TRINITY_DN16182_c4_g1_i1:96-1379(+)
MALNTRSSFVPRILEEKTAYWTIDGFSWIKSKSKDEEVRSPALIQVSRSAFGMALLPGGSSQSADDRSTNAAIYAWVDQKNDEALNIQINAKVLNPASHALQPIDLQTPNKLRLASNRLCVDGRAGTDSIRWDHFSLSDVLKYVDRDNDRLVIQMDIKAWSDDSANSVVSEQAQVYCDAAPKSRLISDLEKLLQSQKHADVSLLVSDSSCNSSETLPAHRLMLAARSPVFESMFFGEGLAFGEKAPDATVKILDTNPSVAKAFLHSLYTGSIPQEVWEDKEMLCHLLAMYHKYQIQDLQNLCEKQVTNQLAEENVAERLMMSDLLGISALRSASLDFLVSSPVRLAAIQLTEGFKRLIRQRPEMLAEILSKAHPPPKQARSATAPELPNNLDELRVVDLKLLLSDRGLKSTGSKQELIDRLRNHCPS